MFHLLGEWREKSAYWPLAVFLRSAARRPRQRSSAIAITETSHRVMAAVFDGDPEPLYEIIRDPEADEYVRAKMLQTIAMLTRRGELPRDATAAFLRDCFSQLEPQEDCYVWSGWVDAVAWLGLTELKPLVQQAFLRGSIDPSGLHSRISKKTCNTRSTIPKPSRFILTASSRCSAIRLRKCPGGTASSRRRRATTRPNGGYRIPSGCLIAIPCAKSGATIPVPAAAGKNSRNAA